jgi:hypothetical protein
MPFDLASSAAAANAALDLVPVSLGGGKVRVAAAVFTCASDAAGTYTAPIRLPRGARVICGFINASATMGASATLAIGIAGATGKYRAAATYTTADTFTLLGLNAALLTPLTAEEQILLTTAVAALPASGRLLIGFLYVQDN